MNRKKVHFLHDDGMPACGKPMSRLSGGSALWQDVTCLLCKETLRQAEKIEADMSKKTVTLYTLAPASLDRAGTESVGSYWLYREISGVQSTGEALSTYDDIPGQALREVTMPESKHIAQHQAYVNHRTFTEVGLNKALARGEVYRPENSVSLDGDAPIIEQTNQKEVQAMPKKKLTKAQIIAAVDRTPQVPAMADMTPLGMVPAPSALDAILAAPIVAAAVVKEESNVVDMAETREEKALAAAMSMQPVGTIPIDLKALAQEIIAALKAEGLVMAHAGIMPAAVEPEPVKDPDIWDILGDGTGASTPMVQPVKPRSTLQVFTNKPAEKTVRASSVNDKTIAAIRKEYLSGGMTQAALARKYELSNQKIWHIVTGK